MAERSTVGRKIYTLETSLKVFDLDCSLEQLDISLELVRRNKVTPGEHLTVLKSVDKNLLKQSLTHHPDTATRGKKSTQEIANAQNQQVALNATRTVLKALTKAFLDDIDIQYKYEFFAKMDISTLINEKEMDRQINNVLCKISLLSEVKRVNIVGEIRKFLQESRKSLSSFQDNDKDEFERHRDYGLRHLRKCIEGYEVLATECEFIAKECRGENDGSARSAIQKIHDQSLRELKILENLERVAESFLYGTFQIYSFNEPESNYDYYLVSPFVFYINVMLMCTLVANRKSRSLKKIFRLNNTDTTPQFNKKPVLFLRAFHLSFYFNNKAQHERDVEILLEKKNLDTTIDNILNEFKDAVKCIKDFLVKEFDIQTYKEGKSNREQFTEKLSKLNESMAGYREVEKKLQEKLNLCKRETNEMRKEYFEFSENLRETEVQSRENIAKCKNISEDMAKLKSGCYQKEDTRSRIFYGNKINKSINSNEIREETTEIKLVKRLEQYEKIAENLLDFLTDCRQNVSKFTGPPSCFGNLNEISPVIKGEVGRKIEASYELNKKIQEQLHYLMTQTPSKITEKISKQDFLTKENLEDSSLKKSSYTNSVDEISGSSDNFGKQSIDLSASEQNVSEKAKMMKIRELAIIRPEKYPVLEEDHGNLLKKHTIEESVEISTSGKLQRTSDQKDKVYATRSLLIEQNAKKKVKFPVTEETDNLNDSSQSMKDTKDILEDEFQSIFYTSSFTSEYFTQNQKPEECTKSFQTEKNGSVIKSDEAGEENGKGTYFNKELIANSKNQFSDKIDRESNVAENAGNISENRMVESSTKCIRHEENDGKYTYTADGIAGSSDIFGIPSFDSSSGQNVTENANCYI